MEAVPRIEPEDKGFQGVSEGKQAPKGKSGIIRPRPFRRTPPLFGGDDEVRIHRYEIYSLRQFQESLGVILPFLHPAFHQFPDYLPLLAEVIETINSIGLQFRSPRVGCLLLEPPRTVAKQPQQPASEQKQRGGLGDGSQSTADLAPREHVCMDIEIGCPVCQVRQ